MGLWNLNGFTFNPADLTDFLKKKSVYRFLNSDFTKRFLKKYLETENGFTGLERLIQKYGSDERGFSKRLLEDRETLIPYIIFEYVCKIFKIDKKNLADCIRDPKIRKSVLNVAETIVEFGVQEPLIFAQPLMIVWNITYGCNLRCKHCYQDAGILSRTKFTELNRDEKIMVMEEIVKTNIPTFAFAGGEPLMDPVFWDVAKIGKDAGLYMSINTNGTLITEKIAEKLKEIGFAYYGVSIDGASPETHDDFRGVKGAFEKALNGIKNLIRVGEANKVCISFTVTRENKDDIEKIIRLRDELGIRKVVFYNYIPCGRAGIENDLSPFERESIFEIFYNDLKEKNNSLLSTAPQFGRYCRQMYESHLGDCTVIGHFSSSAITQLDNLAELIGGCGASRAYLALQPDGSITPCVFMPDLKIGNIKKEGIISYENLLNTWRHSGVLNRIRDRRFHPNHTGCNGKYFSVCGGCVARIYAYTRDFASCDPGCIYNCTQYEKIKSEVLGVV
ncbi:MAG: radical SAM protein [Candidatus Omnitrophica bacterium]|nr:radical SAM protein [Candidatus Omnitrophota bacterium]